MSTVRVHHRFTVDEYHDMIDTGILTENDRVELIRGEIIEKMPIGNRHIATVNRLNRLLTMATGNAAVVSVQNPVAHSDSEPEPDIALLEPREDFYESSKPRADDALLVIDVAESSLDFDRQEKLPLYAEAGIQECWIVNLIDDCIEVHRNPQSDGRYLDVKVLRRSNHVTPLAFPNLTLAVAQIL